MVVRTDESDYVNKRVGAAEPPRLMLRSLVYLITSLREALAPLASNRQK